jgi:hypothetical protein
MDQKETRDILMEILCHTVNLTSGDASFHDRLTNEAVTEVYKLARKHSLAQLVSRYVFLNELPLEPSLKVAMQKASIKTAYKHERMKYALSEICNTFDEEGIAYIPLKGSVLRSYYPEEDMRTSCDIDVLIHEEDLERAVRLLEAKDYQGGERRYHDISLHSSNGTHLELHFNILENMDNLDAVLKDAWKHAKPVGGSRYAFSEEFFVFHMYAHMAYHFFSGGCGIRSLMDIWIMEHKMGVDFKCAEKLLKKAGIDIFAKEMSSIANRCFSDFDASDIVLSYIWRGGVYGNKRNHIAVQKKMEGSTSSYILKRIFLPYRGMVVTYPILKKLSILLLFCWIHRGVKAIINGKSANMATEIACVNQISKDELAELTEIFMRLGF